MALLNSGANINKANPNATKWNGETPLIAAVEAGNANLVKLLIANGWCQGRHRRMPHEADAAALGHL